MYAQHHAGSLELLVERTKRRNMAAAGALLVLIVAAGILLIAASRRAQRLADQQMSFVAGVSHELRTPLSVIRTAAYNLRGKISKQPESVERYGRLIQDESEKLGAMVEQILRFASSEAGRVIREPSPTHAETIVDAALASMRDEIERRGAEVERRISPAIPPILADADALQRAIRNLIENALKYGGGWIGVSVAAAGACVEIRVADRGSGIPADELSRIFEPFFRGRAPLAEQIHGTGLGLSLVKKIVEAHGGSVAVDSDPSRGTEFIVRIPAAYAESKHEFAHSAG